MGRSTTQRVVNELKKIKKRFMKTYKIEKMLLFGSRARAEELITSDVDVIIVSPDFGTIPFRKRPNKFLDAWKLSVDLEVLCYSPEEFKRKQKEYGLVRVAAKEGRLI